MRERFKKTFEQLLDRVDELVPNAKGEELCSLGRLALDVCIQINYLEPQLAGAPAPAPAEPKSEDDGKPAEIIAKPEHDKVDDDPFAIDSPDVPKAEIVSNDVDVLRSRLDKLKAKKGGK